MALSHVLPLHLLLARSVTALPAPDQSALQDLLISLIVLQLERDAVMKSSGKLCARLARSVLLAGCNAMCSK